MAYANTIGFDPTVKYVDTGMLNRPPFALGTIIKGRDGHDYVFAKASGTIGASTAAVLTEPAMTMAAGAGSWTTLASPTFVANDYGWFKKTAI